MRRLSAYVALAAWVCLPSLGLGSILETLPGNWSVQRNYTSDPMTGGMSGSTTFAIKVTLRADGTLRMLSSKEEIADNLLGSFSADSRTILDLKPDGRVIGSTTVNRLKVESIKGTWALKSGRIEATLYSSSRTGARVTSNVRVRKTGPNTLLAVEDRADGLSVTTVATRAP